MKTYLLASAVSLVMLGVALGAIGCGKDKKQNNTSPTATAAASDTPAATAIETPPAGGTPAASANEVEVRLLDYKIAPNPTTIAAGDITFNVTNIGSVRHEVVVIKTDLAEGDLPTSADGSAEEQGTGVEIIGEIDKVTEGTSKSGTITLEAGNYVLICNIVDTTNGQTVSHYHEGMHIAFAVTP